MSWKVVLGIVGGAAVGGTAAYLIARSRYGQKAIGAAEEVITETGVRFPEPSFAMDLPYTEDQFDVLDDLVCECGDPVIAAAQPDATVDEVVQAIQDCMATQLYPDFPWPPIPGDHPTVGQLYAELGVVARRAVAKAQICPGPLPPLPAVPVPSPNPGGLRWR